MADEDVKIVIKQKGTIPVYTTTKMAGSDIITDETLSGKGTSSLPLKISEEIIQEIHNAGKVDDVKVDGQSVVVDKIAEIDLTGKVDKVSSADKVYGTDSQGNQTTYNVDSFGQVDDVKVNGASVVENKIANVTVPTKTSDITNDSGYITKSVDDLTNYTKTSDLASVATSGSYNDLSNTPTIGDGTLTIQKNGTTVATFTANQTGNVTANIVADQQVQADWNEADTTAPDYIKNKPTKVSDFTNDAGYQNSSQVEAAITVNDVQVNGLTVVSNKVASITLPAVIDNTTSESTTDALSANQGRVLQSEIESLQGRGRFLSVWNSATGLAETNPPSSPYTYHNGDYFIVGTVAASGGTNYKPNGSSYTTGVASTTVETETVAVNDTYLYDGTVWHLQQNAQRETTFANVAGSPYDNQNLATALNAKADSTDIGNATLTIQKNSTQVGTFTANSKTDATINITVPTTASDVGAVAANADITGATKCKITYDSKGLVTAGADLAVSDIPDLSATYQPLLTPGTNISITNNVISSTAQESFFRGKWNTWTNVPSDSSLYPADFHGNHIPLENDYMIVEDSSGYVEDFPIEASIVSYGTGGWDTKFYFTIGGETKDIQAPGTYTYSNGVVITAGGSTWGGRNIQINRNFKIGSTIYPKDTNYDLKGSVTSMKIATENPTVYEGVWRFSYHGVWATNGKDGWKPEYQVEDVLPTADANTLGIAKLYTSTGNNTDGAIDQATVTTALGEKQDVILDLDTIKSGASLGATSLQPNDNISELNNDSGYTTNVGTVTSVNNVQPDANGNVTISIPSSDVTDVQIYGVSKVTSGVANLNVVEQVTSLPLSDVWMGRTVQYVGIDFPANDIYRGYYYIYETRPYGDHMSRTGWWQLNTQPQGGASSVSNLTDVELTNLTNGQTLVYNSNSSKWVNGNAGVTITYNAETEELTIS